MKKLRWLTLALLATFLVLAFIGVVSTYQTSQHSLFDRWGTGRLVFHSARIVLEIAIVGVAIARGSSTGLLLRIPALAIVAFRLAFLATLLPGYMGNFQRLGFSVHTVTIVIDYLSFSLALFFLLADWSTRRRAALASARGIQPAQS